MKTPLKSAVRDLYDDVKLSPTELEQIKSDGANHASAASQNHRMIKWKPVYNIAAVVCLCVMSVALWQLAATNANRAIDKTEVIIADVIDNHLAYKTMQYQTTSLAELSQHFSYLGFMLATSKPMQTIGLDKLLGARPCLILDIPAAQLRYQIDDNRWATVFQTRYQKNIYGPVPDILDKQQPLMTTNRGVNVSLWREGDLLFAVAHPH